MLLLEFLLKLRRERPRFRLAGSKVDPAFIEEEILAAFGQFRLHLAERQAADFGWYLAILGGNGRA